MKKRIGIILSTLVIIALVFRFCCGIFVIQPMGVVPDGATVVYWRFGTDMPFIASADRLLAEEGKSCTTHERGELLVSLKPKLIGRAFMKLGYSEKMYDWSMGK